MIIKKANENYIIPNPKTAQGYKCYLCGGRGEHLHHIIYGNGKRRISDREGLLVALCTSCHWKIHNRHTHDKELKKMAQETWMKYHGGDTKDTRNKWYKQFYKFYD